MLSPKFTLGEMIRTARERKGMTRTKLAEFTGISPNTLVKYELAQEEGGKTPALPKMVTIARVLEIDPRWIFQRIYDYQVKEHDNFSFRNHFATDTDFLNWKLAVKDVEELNAVLEQHLYEFQHIDQRLARIEQNRLEEEFRSSPEYNDLQAKMEAQISQLRKSEEEKQNGPDRDDPSRPEQTSNNPEAVGAASTNHTKGRD